MNIPDEKINYEVTEDDWEDFWYGEDDDSSISNESESE